jgi:hypothetical protein
MSSRNRNGRVRLLAAWLAAAGFAFAQNPSPAPADKPASVAGVVTNSVTGAPVTRAHVALRVFANGVQQTYGALTNGEGKFSITQLPPGQYSASVDRVGFVMPANASASQNFSVTLRAGDRKDDLNLTLTPAGAIVGRVLTSEGEPVQGASVEVAVGGGAGSPVAVTDERGQFRLGGLRPGKYRVKASPQALPLPPEIRADGAQEPHYSPTYFAASLEAQSATRIEVRPAAELSGIEIRLVRTPIVTVSGRVSGFPADARVQIQAQRSSRSGSSMSSANSAKPDGSFQLWRLEPGKYTLSATSYVQGARQRLQSAPVEIEVGGVDIENIELRLIPPFDITGVVRFEDEQARGQGQPQTAATRMPPRRILLQPAGGAGMYAVQPADVAADDTFTLEKVQPGRYRVNLGWGPAYVKSVRLGSTETEGDILDVSGGPAGPLTLVVSSVAGELSGTVTDSKGPVPGATIQLVFVGGGVQPRGVAKTDQGGVYRFGGIPPGAYKLLFVDETGEVEDEADSPEFVLRSGDKLTRDLKQPSTDGK